MSLNRWSRKVHRWGAVAIVFPSLLVIVTGLLLQLKKDVAWVQPTTARGAGGVAALSWEELLQLARDVPEAEVRGWDDIDRLDVRPGRSLIKIRCRNYWELQIDWSDGTLLSSTMRRSDWIETLHDGSIFGDFSKYYIFLPSGVVLLGLWLTGVYLWYLPIGVRRRKRLVRRQRSMNGQSTLTDGE